MMRVIPLVIVLALGGCTTVASVSPAGSDPAATEDMIRSLELEAGAALLSRDYATLERLWAEEFVVNAPLNVVAPNRQFVLERIRQGLIRHDRLEPRIEEIRISGDVAIVMGAESVQAAEGAAFAGQPLERRFTHVWRNAGGSWRLVARHANNVCPQPAGGLPGAEAR
jgi:ketosteroid isomerase-like protein